MPTNRSSAPRQTPSPHPGLGLSAIPNLRLSNSPPSNRRCLAGVVVYSVTRHNYNHRMLNSRHLHVCLKYQINAPQLTDYLSSIWRGSNSWPDFRHRTLRWREPIRRYGWSAAAATHATATCSIRRFRTIRRQQTRGACWVSVWGRPKSTAGDHSATATRTFRWFHAWPKQPFAVDVGRRVVW